MIPNFNKAERRDLIIEISDFHSKHAPDEFANDIPVLMELVRDQKQDIYRRGGAMETLSAADLSESQQEELTGLLVAEIRAPQKGEYFSGTLGYALEALASLPHPERHLDLLLALPHVPKDAFGEGFAAVDSMTRDNPAREKILAEFLKTQFAASSGMMNDHFTKVLAHNLRILAREITALWSEKDEETLARMWIAFVAAHPGDFQDSEKPSNLRELAAKHIRALPAAERKEAIAAILKEIPIPEYFADSLKWLNSLT